MKTSFILPIFCFFFIVACVPQQTTITPQVINTTTPFPTSIPISTTTPTETALPSATPTEAGPKSGDIITENGYTYTYMIVPESGYKGWFRSAALFPLLPWQFLVPVGVDGWELPTKVNDFGPIQLYVEKGIRGEQQIESLTQSEFERGVAPDNNYVMYGFTIIEEYYEHKTGESMLEMDGRTKQNIIQGGKINVPVNTAISDFMWTPSPTSGSTIYLIKPVSTVITPENGFHDWYTTDSDGGHFASAYWGVDSDGLVGAITLIDKPLNQLNERDLRMIPIYHQITAILAATEGESVDKYGYAHDLDFLLMLADGDPPVIQINYKK